jgi:hypothetical protein
MPRAFIDTNEYVFEHGHAPRGQGTWAFSISGRDETFWHTGTYRDAKKAAIAEAKKSTLYQLGWSTICVLP